MKQLSTLLIFSYVISLLISGFVYHRDNRLFAQTADAIVKAGMTEEEEAEAIHHFVFNLEYYEIANGDLPPDSDFNTALYKAIPINLIPPQVNLQHHLVYRGACGAKSRLLSALLDARGFDTRMRMLLDRDYLVLHTVIEVKLSQGWVPLDATDGEPFYTANGHLATTDQITDPRYQNVSSFTPFYVIFTAGRIAGFWEFADSESVFESFNSVIPAGILDAQLGIPLIYERPKLLPSFLLNLLTVAALAFQVILRYARRRHTLGAATAKQPKLEVHISELGCC